MSFDDLQQLWETQPAGEVPLVASQKLLAQVKADSREFDALIRTRDRRELRACLAFGLLFAFVGLLERNGPARPWPFFAAAACMLFIALYLLAGNLIAGFQRLPETETLLGDVTRALGEVQRQAGLLRSVAWWYLLPAQTAWWLFGLGVLSHLPHHSVHLWLLLCGCQLFWTWLLWRGTVRVYRLNQRAVRDELEPRIARLEGLLANWSGPEH